MSAPDDVPAGTTGTGILVLCHMMKAMACAWLGEFDESEGSAEVAAKLAQASDRPYDLVAATYGRGVVQMMRGNLEDAEIALNEAFRLSSESEVRIFLPLVMTALGNLHVLQDEIEPARDFLLRAKEEAEALGHETSKVALPVYLGSLYGQAGDTQRALELVRACQAGAKHKGYGGIEALAALTEANILAAQGEHMADEASDCLRGAFELATKLEAQPLLGAAMGLRARLFAAAGRITDAQNELAQAVALFDRAKMTAHLERAKAALSKYSDT
jgi:ATP/maltotriose-dependent transcriptional regulator MalT